MRDSKRGSGLRGQGLGRWRVWVPEKELEGV